MDKFTANQMVEELSNDFQSEVEKMTAHYVEFEAMYEKSLTGELETSDYFMTILKNQLENQRLILKMNGSLATIAAILAEALPEPVFDSEE